MDSSPISYSLISFCSFSGCDSRIKHQESAVSMHQKIKDWLGLTRGVTNAVIHHPNVIDIPTIAEYHKKAKLTCLSSILTSKDPMISEISELLLDQDFTRSQRIPSEVNQILDLAKNSISTYHINAQVSVGIIMWNTGITNLVNWQFNANSLPSQN